MPEGLPQLTSRLAEAEGLAGAARAAALAVLATDTAFLDPRRALDLVARARDDAAGDEAAAAALDYAEALARFYLGETAAAMTSSVACAAAFERLGDEAARSQSLSLLADACNRAGRLATAGEAGALALQCAQRAGDLPALAWAICALGNTMLARGEHGRAADLYTASRDVFVAADDPMGEAWMTGNLGEALLRAGDVESATAAHERCLELVMQCAPTTAGVVHAMLASSHTAAGRYAEALESAVEAVRRARVRGARDEEAYALACAGQALVRLDRLGEARTMLDEALRLGRETDLLEAEHGALLGLGDLHAALGDDGAAVAALEEAVLRAGADTEGGMAARANRALAEAHERAGRYREAYAALKAADTAERRPLPADDPLHEVVTAYLADASPRSGITLICAACKSVHDTLADHWHPVEGYLTRALEVRLSHGLCPDCFTRQMGLVG